MPKKYVPPKRKRGRPRKKLPVERLCMPNPADDAFDDTEEFFVNGDSGWKFFGNPPSSSPSKDESRGNKSSSGDVEEEEEYAVKSVDSKTPGRNKYLVSWEGTYPPSEIGLEDMAGCLKLVEKFHRSENNEKQWIKILDWFEEWMDVYTKLVHKPKKVFDLAKEQNPPPRYYEDFFSKFKITAVIGCDIFNQIPGVICEGTDAKGATKPFRIPLSKFVAQFPEYHELFRAPRCNRLNFKAET